MCSLEIGSSSLRRSIQRKSAGANPRNFSQTLSQLSCRGFVCDNQGVAHEEDHRCIKPLTTGVLAAEQRTNQAIIARTESMLPQHTDFRRKEGAPLDGVSATSMRTVEVTICIIQKDCSIALNRYRTAGDPGCRRQRLRCHCPGYRMFFSW